MDNFLFSPITCFVMNDLTIYHYRLKSPVELQYRGSGKLGAWNLNGFPGHRLVSRTKEEGYALAAWLLVKGVPTPVLCINGDCTPIDIEEGDDVFLTWKPGLKPEIQFNAIKFQGYQLLAYPPADAMLLKDPSTPATPL